MQGIEKSALVSLVSLSFVLAGLAAGCGGDSDDGEAPAPSGQVDTGLPESMVLSDVTSAQYLQACQSVKTAVSMRLNRDTLTPPVCEVVGASQTDTADQCQALASLCVDQLKSGNSPLFDVSMLDFGNDIQCDGDVTDLDDCGITVGQFETCSNDTIDAVEKALADRSCAHAATVGREALTQLTMIQSMATPPSCEPLQSRCPNLLMVLNPPR
jgi:hypothetical protein